MRDRVLTTLADSPMYLSTTPEATTLRKLASILEAMALASSVFPVPENNRKKGEALEESLWDTIHPSKTASKL